MRPQIDRTGMLRIPCSGASSLQAKFPLYTITRSLGERGAGGFVEAKKRFASVIGVTGGQRPTSDLTTPSEGAAGGTFPRDPWLGYQGK